jgi:hypothetical protein
LKRPQQQQSAIGGIRSESVHNFFFLASSAAVFIMVYCCCKIAPRVRGFLTGGLLPPPPPTPSSSLVAQRWKYQRCHVYAIISIESSYFRRKVLSSSVGKLDQPGRPASACTGLYRQKRQNKSWGHRLTAKTITYQEIHLNNK